MGLISTVADQGRGGDTRLAHVTPGEVVIPKEVAALRPDLVAHVGEQIRAMGGNPQSLTVGRGRINPATGIEEFATEAEVTAAYQNTLGRAPEAAGLAYWMGQDNLSGFQAAAAPELRSRVTATPPPTVATPPPMVAAQAAQTAPVVAGVANATLGTAQTRSLDQNEMSGTQLNGLIADNSKYIQNARANALATANDRGLINSSMAAGAGEKAAIESAQPFALQQAGAVSSYLDKNLANQQQTDLTNASLGTSVSTANAGYLTDANRATAANTTAVNTANAGYSTDASRTNYTGALDAAKTTAGFQSQAQLQTAADTAAAARLLTSETGANDRNSATLIANAADTLARTTSSEVIANLQAEGVNTTAGAAISRDVTSAITNATHDYQVTLNGIATSGLNEAGKTAAMADAKAIYKNGITLTYANANITIPAGLLDGI